MPTIITDELTKEKKEIDILELLPPDEGEINQIYGRIGSGKTYCATKDIIDDLNRGQVWYVNWKINWKGYDQRDYWFYKILGILGLKKTYYVFKKENLHYVDLYDLQNIKVDGISTGKEFIAWLSTITDAKLAFDEGHIAFNSYEKTKIGMERINAVMWARHFDRSYLIISQRPSAIHITLRANVNRFYKCEKVFKFKIGKWTLLRFKKTEFQDTDDNDKPKEDKIKKLNEETHMLEDTEEYQYAISEKRYWGRKKIFKMYDTKYRRDGMLPSQVNQVDIIQMSPKKFLQKWFMKKETEKINKILENKNFIRLLNKNEKK